MNSGMHTGLIVFSSAIVSLVVVLVIALSLASVTEASIDSAKPDRAIVRAVQQNIDLEMRRRAEAAQNVLKR